MSSEHRQRRCITVGDIRCSTLKEAAKLINLSCTTLYRKLKAGEYIYNGIRIADTHDNDISETAQENLSGCARKPAVAFFECIASDCEHGELRPVYSPLLHNRKPGDLLLRYPLGESPIMRGLYVYH